MLRRISNVLRRSANSWLALLSLGGILVFNLLILPGQQERLRAASGGTGIIDAEWFYSPEKAYAMVASYGDAGRLAYRTFELTGDILYPVLYTLLFSLLITWFFRMGFRAESSLQMLNVVPFGAWLTDLCENLSIAAMLTVYPFTPGLLGWMGAVFTLLKWLFVAASAALVVAGFFAAGQNKFRKQEMRPAKL